VSGEPAPPRSQPGGFLHGRDAALGAAFHIVLALGPQHVGLHRFRRLDQCQQAGGSRTIGGLGEQTAHQALLPQMLSCGAWSEQLLAPQGQQRLLEGIELADPACASRSSWALCQAGGAAKAEAHRNQRLLTQVLPELNQPRGQELPVFWIASRSLLGLLTQVLPLALGMQ
jgi:hypothetical protein